MNITQKIFCFLCALGVAPISYAFLGALLNKLNPFNALREDRGHTWRTDSIVNRVTEICVAIEKKDYNAVGQVFEESHSDDRRAILQHDNQRVMRAAQALQNEFSEQITKFYEDQMKSRSFSWHYVTKSGTSIYVLRTEGKKVDETK